MKVPNNAALGKATVTLRLIGYGRIKTEPVTYEIEVLSHDQVAQLRRKFPKPNL